MTIDPAHVAHARKVADAILYEGYLLYPYRKSAQKNQVRFQFGVLMPPAYGAVDPCEAAASQTECLAECPDDATIWVQARFLQLRQRTVQALESGELRDTGSLRVDNTEYTPWAEAAEREHQASVPLAALLGDGADLAIRFDDGQESADITGHGGERAGRLLYRWGVLDAGISLRAERTAGPYGAVRLRLRLENRTEPRTPLHVREDGLRHALIAAHLLIGVQDGTFLSMTDPPEWAAAEVAACTNTGTWPVLAGPADCRNLMLSSPVILYDHPEIAPESSGDLFDATEIDEILTLRTLAMTDEEKAEARATDPRAADLMDRLDDLPPEMLEKMHGAIRYLAPGKAPQERTVPWWDPGSDTTVSPETDQVMVGDVPVARGSVVIMRPGARRADAQDLFLTGRRATVEAVLFDVDGNVHLAVVPEGDPEVAELQRSQGRFLYFAPDEIEPG